MMMVGVVVMTVSKVRRMVMINPDSLGIEEYLLFNSL